MPSDIFNLNFNYWGVFLLSGVPALINIGLFIYSSFFLPQNRINRLFSVFVLLLGLGQIADGLIRMSNSEETALLWSRISAVPWIFVPPFGLLFTLKFTGWNKKLPSVLFTFLFLPTILFNLMMTARMDQYIIVKSEQWNWIVNPASTPVTNAIYIWMAGIAFLMTLFLWFHFIKERHNQNKKHQALILAIGFTLPLLVGIIAEMIFPLTFKFNSIPLTTPSLVLFSISAIIAIKKYNILDYSPRHQWNTIIENMNEGVLIVDNSDRIMYANKKFCQLTDYTFQEIKGKIAGNLFIEDHEHKELIEQSLEERKSKKSGQYEIQIRTKYGKKIWMLISGSPYLDTNGKVIGSIGVQTNICKIKEIEKKLESNNSRLKQAQAIAHVGSWELNFATGKAVWSEEALRMYGLPLDQAEQSFDSWISCIHPDDLDAVKKEIEKSQVALSNSSFIHRIVCRDGSIKHIHSVSMLEFSDGIPVGLVGICHDITEKTTTQNKLEKSENRVRSFANHLNNTLENERAYIAREIHDELGQYLTGLKLGLSSLKNQANGNAKLNTRIEDMISDVIIGQQSVRKIATKLRPGILDTLGLTQSITWLVKEFEKKVNIKYQIEIDKDAEGKYKQHISTCFFRVCQEALTNISKHAEASEVIIKMQKSPSELTLIISDNGKGISNEKLENPFSMGLLGMKERATLIGGNLRICSKRNEGTIIQLTLNMN